ncbi:MAG: hypothetical protein M1831_007498 [Alyxoria varia]|nr:MAG: hypothetical protein M1831_007498 [Alyxoria varia]
MRNFCSAIIIGFMSPAMLKHRKRSAGPEESLTWSLQALLVRHEAYVADAERERSHLTSTIANLEGEQKAVEQENERLVEENRTLLDQVEDLNTSVAESDTHVKSLTATLQSTNQELHRVRGFAARAENLELQLLELETEQAQLRNLLSNSREEERAANARWHNTQRLLADLEAQVEIIEKEAREDRQRHAEIVDRLEKRKTVERVLEKPTGAQPNGNNNEVVSGFVKEILEDNANLQLSMSELQELLFRSKEETEFLKNQLSEAQTADEHEPPWEHTPAPTLDQEIPMPERHISQELHVHHHYHTPTTFQIQRVKPSHQRPRRGRRELANARSGRSTPTPARSHSRIESIASSASSVPPTLSARPSFSMSSDPSSPQSVSYAPSTIFEYTSDLDRTETSSRPTSPESSAFYSPAMKPSHSKHGSDDSAFSHPLSTTIGPPTFQIAEEREGRRNGERPIPRSSVQTSPTRNKGDGSTHTPSNSISHDELYEPTYHEEHTPKKPNDSHQSPDNDSSSSEEDTPRQHQQLPQPQPQPTATPTLRRNPSTSSLYSISGMDIHSTFPTANVSTPSRSTDTLPPFMSLRSKPSLNFSTTHSSPSGNDPVLTAATASASASKNSNFKDSGSILREKFGASVGKNAAARGENAKGPMAGTSEGGDDTYTPLLDTLGRRVGGWLSGRWTTTGGVHAGVGQTSQTENGGEAASASGLNTQSTLTPALGSSVSVQDLRSKASSQSQFSEPHPADPVGLSTPASPSSASSRQKSKAPSHQPFHQRPPGINQPGALPVPRRVFKPVVRVLDEGSLRESLADIVEDE